MDMQEIYENNFRLITRNNLHIGTILEYKKTGQQIVITNIHPLYGWVIAHGDVNLSQDLSNLKDFEIKG